MIDEGEPITTIFLEKYNHNILYKHFFLAIDLTWAEKVDDTENFYLALMLFKFDSVIVQIENVSVQRTIVTLPINYW